MKDYLTKLIESKKNEIEELKTRSDKSEDLNEVRSIGNQITAVRSELKAAEEQLAKIEADENKDEEKDFKPMGTYGGMEKKEEMMDKDIEQRLAFANYVASGGKKEYRADSITDTTGAAAVIPANLMNQIIEKYDQVGTIYNLVSKTAYPVGQTFPVDGVKPSAVWANEGAGTDAQSKTMGASIVFAHYKVRCEIAWTQEVDVMTLPIFEAMFVRQAGEAIIKAVESKIIEGTGSSQMQGILTSTPPTGQAITLAEGTALSYSLLCDLEAAIPAQCEAGAKYVMTKKTFMAFMAMVDNNGQPIARINYGVNGRPERMLLGRDVVLYEPQSGSILKSYASSITADQFVLFAFDFSDYVLNNNYNLGIEMQRDWDTENMKVKAVAAFDGKPIRLDSLVTLKQIAG